MNNIYAYNLGHDEIKKRSVKDHILTYFIDKSKRFLGNRYTIKIDNDPNGIAGPILNWIDKGQISKDAIKLLNSKISSQLKTRSIEVQRFLISFLAADSFDKKVYVFHVKEIDDALDENFENLIKVGLSEQKILRVFEFFKVEENKLQMRFRERNKTKLLRNIFQLENNSYDSFGKVMVRGKIYNDINVTLTIPSFKFKEYIDTTSISVENNKLKIFDDFSLKLHEIQYNSNIYRNTKSDFKKFKKYLDETYDPHEGIIEEYKFAIDSWKIKTGVKLSGNLDSYFDRKRYGGEYTFFEQREFVLIKNRDKDFAKIQKPEDLWGDFIVIDDEVELSPDFSLELAQEFISGAKRRMRFINLPFNSEPIHIGKKAIFNALGLKSGNQEILNILQNDFETSDSPKRRRLLLLGMMCLIIEFTNYSINQSFFSVIINDILSLKTKIINQEISEDRIFEFKRNDILNNPISTVASKIADAIKPNLYNTGISLLMVGYDEDNDEVQQIPVEKFRSENRILLVEKIKHQLKDDEICINISIIRDKQNSKSVLFIVAANHKKTELKGIETLFEIPV